MQKATLGLLITLLPCAPAGCGKVSKSEASSNKPSSNVATTEPSPGVTQGQFVATSTSNQVMVGSPNGNVAEDYITVPPGALAINTNITLGEGKDLGSTPPSDLGLAAGTVIAGGSPPVLLDANPATATTAAPFTLNIPIPLSATSSASLNLVDGTSKVGLMYLVKTATGNKVGFYALGASDLVGAYVAYKSASFGWFRVVVLSAATATAEKTTTLSPSSK